MTAPLPRLPWHRRLSFRLAVLLAILLLLFDYVGPHVHRALHEWVGVDEGPHFTQWEALPSEWHAKLEAVNDAALAVLDGGSDAELAAVQRALIDWRPTLPYVFLIADAHLVLRGASPCLRATLHEPVALRGPEADLYDWMPLRREQAVVGWMCVFPPSAEARANGYAAERPDDRVAISEAELDARWRHMALLGEILGWVLRVGFIALVALCFSWGVTRRLVRLADFARRAPAALPGDVAPADASPSAAPVLAAPVRGSDEIAALASALTDSRARVQLLLAELATRDQARREWIAQVSHDLRTPLTALVARLERALPTAVRLPARLAANDPARSDADDLRQAIDVALADADRVAQLARDLLEAARLELPAQLVREPLLVGELLERVGQELAPLAAKAQLQLGIGVPSGLPAVSGDGRRLLRVLENLLRNAIEHARTRVDLRASLAGAGVCIEVLDDGPGLRGADRHRADATGLGLQVARRILAAHGSALDLADRDEGGCRSSFVLAR